MKNAYVFFGMSLKSFFCIKKFPEVPIICQDGAADAEENGNYNIRYYIVCDKNTKSPAKKCQ